MFRRRDSFDEKDILKAIDILLEKSETPKGGGGGGGGQERRRGRQVNSVTPDLTGFQQDEVCEVTGFESRKREECKEVRETECEEVEVTKFRMEIKKECKTKHDQACNITMKEVPSQECQPSIEEKCDIAFRVVEKQVFNEECQVDVQHICEEHINIPVLHPPSYLPPPPAYLPPPNYHPAGFMPQYTTSFSGRTKREDQQEQEQVVTPEVIFPQLGGSLLDIKNNNQQDQLSHLVKEQQLKSENILLTVMEDDQSLDEVNATRRKDLQQQEEEFHVHVPLVKESLNSKRDEAKLAEAERKIVSTHELPAPYGCRSVATKGGHFRTCSRVPMTVAKKMPYEKCKQVPSVDCGLVLKKVPELLCFPEVYEDCKDVAQEVPFIGKEEKCEELLFDDCVEVEEKVPVEVCKRKRLDEESIFLSRGPVFRKEGPKSRRPIPSPS